MAPTSLIVGPAGGKASRLPESRAGEFSGSASIAPAFDPGADRNFTVHRHATPRNGVWHLEGLVNLDRVPARGATIFVGVLRARRRASSPWRSSGESVAGPGACTIEVPYLAGWNSRVLACGSADGGRGIALPSLPSTPNRPLAAIWRPSRPRAWTPCWTGSRRILRATAGAIGRWRSARAAASSVYVG